MTEGTFKLRVRYAKEGRLRYLSHLEVLRTVDRCIRRSGLPFAVTCGFSPHMRIAFSSALPTATSSECEYYDLIVSSLVPVGEALGALVSATLVDLAPLAAGYVDTHEPALEAWLDRSRWHVDLRRSDIDARGLDSSIAAVAATKTIEYQRGSKTKHVDLTTTLVGWACGEDESGDLVTLDLETRSGQSGSLRPAILLEAALAERGFSSSDVAYLHVSRTGQWHEGGNSLQDPLSRCTGAVAGMNLA